MTPALIALACACIAYFVSGYLLAHGLRARKLDMREDKSFSEIHGEHFKELGISREVAERIWDEAARRLKLNPRKLRPADRFDSELSHQSAWFPFVDLNDDFYWWTVERMKLLKLEREVFEDVRTLGDYIRVFTSLESGDT